MNTEEIINQSKRDFMKAGAVLTLAVAMPKPAWAAAGSTEADKFIPNAFLRIGEDNVVTIISKHMEMGQGSYTGIATLLAEELDADWSQIRVQGAEADVTRYANLLWGAQGTGGSSAMANSYEQMRKAGASARAMLVTAAANQWKVKESELTTVKGVVVHKASGKSAEFGELVDAASQLPVPKDVKLKDAKEFNYIGKHAPRVDAREKSTGTATFTQDIQLPGMLVAMAAHAPRFGGKVKSFDASKTKAIKGVVNVVEFETPMMSGVAVLAKDTWTAKKGRDALIVEWDESNAFKMSSDEVIAQYRELAKKPGKVARNDGDADAALAKADKVIEATYEFPFLAHASMEAMNCVAQVTDEGCELWYGAQGITWDQMTVSKFLGIQIPQVKINQLYAGGSFGRRANPQSDYVLEAVAIAKANGTAPVKLVWTREDDTRAGFFRPMYLHSLKAGLDKDNNIIAWRHRIVGQSIFSGAALPIPMENGIDPSSVEGAANLPYAIPNLRVELHTADIGVPVQWWRAVGSTHTGYATECFLDEIALTAKKDPYELRRKLLAEQPRHKGALELVAKKAGWDKPLAKGKTRGIAVHKSFNSYVAEVVELSQTEKNTFSIDRITCAVDCGVAINPKIIQMQMESCMGYGLAAAFTGEITLKEGAVEQSNFHDYQVLRINQAPDMEVYIVPSTENPTGVGEPGLPPTAPALSNALLQMTGEAVRVQPLSKKGYKFV